MTISPENAFGIIGGKSEITCELGPGSANAITYELNGGIIYSFINGKEDYPKGRNKYQLQVKRQSFTLEINNLTFSDGGRYECLTDTGRASATLCIFGKLLV